MRNYAGARAHPVKPLHFQSPHTYNWMLNASFHCVSQIMNDIKKGIQYAFQTENNMTLSMSGSGHAAMECAVFNTVEPGESVLISINGIWGERVAEIAERMGRFLRTDFTHARSGSKH